MPTSIFLNDDDDNDALLTFSCFQEGVAYGRGMLSVW